MLHQLQVNRSVGLRAMPTMPVGGLIWDPKINTEGSTRFIQGVIDKYNHTPTSRCYLGYAAMMQILDAM
jgi:branched-chain amino acid transport system substrate-binding protein